MRHSTALKTSNMVLKKLNERYYVSTVLTEKKKKPTRFLVYDAPDTGGLYFMFEVEAKPTSMKCVMFDGHRYDDVDKLVAAAQRYNEETLFFPSFCYDPNTRAQHACWQKINWYLTERLGFEHPLNYLKCTDTNSYVLMNIWKEPACGLHVDIKDDFNSDNIDGKIRRWLPGDRWIEMTFANVEEAIEKINTMVTAELLFDINTRIKSLEQIDGNFSNMEDVEIINAKNPLNPTYEKVNDTLIPMLEKLLAELKAGQQQ